MNEKMTWNSHMARMDNVDKDRRIFLEWLLKVGKMCGKLWGTTHERLLEIYIIIPFMFDSKCDC